MAKKESSDATEVSDKTTSDVKEKDTTSSSKAPVSEEFQTKVMELISTANDDELDFLHDQCYKKEAELRKKKDVSMDDYDDVISSPE